MNNYLLNGIYIINLALYSMIVLDEFKKNKIRNYKLTKNKNNLIAYIQNQKIEKPKYKILNQNEKIILAELLLKLKKENKQQFEFAKKIILYTNKANLRNLGNNFQLVKINNVKKNFIKIILLRDTAAGSFNPSTKNINIYNNKITTLNHELLHASSCSTTHFSVGFHVKFKNSDEFGEIGVGLNEGYTELLNNRIFKKPSISYITLNKIAYIIELLFENKKEMENYYFNNDLIGIIYELNKYIKKEEIIELLTDIDRIYYNEYNIIDYF